MDHHLSLIVLEEHLAICRMPPGSQVPGIVFEGNLSAVIYTPDEVTFICPVDRVPEGVQTVSGWRALKVQGPLDFSLTGVLVSLALPLSQHGVSIYALSTYDTDYVLVREESLGEAIAVLRGAGHMIETPAA